MQKDIQLLFEYAQIHFTGTDHKIAAYFLDRKPVKSIEELAEDIGVSTASITRFCKKVGLRNFKEFLFLYQQQLETPTPLTENCTLHVDYVDMLQQLSKKLDRVSVKTFSDAVYQHKIIHVFGTGFSALAGADFKFRFTRLGKFIEVVTDGDSMKMISAILNPDALVILISLKGKNEGMIQCAREMKTRGVNVLCITSNSKSKLIQYSDSHILTSSLNGEESTGMISGQTPILMAIDHIYHQYVTDNKDKIKNWVATEKPFCS